MINLSEIMIYSVLSLFKWSFVCAMDEHFFFTFITSFNVGIVFITQTTRLLMGALENPMYELISGNFNLSMNSGVFIFWKVFIIIIALILLTGGIIISYRKYKVEWRVSRNFAKCKKWFCEKIFAKMNAKFRENGYSKF